MHYSITCKKEEALKILDFVSDIRMEGIDFNIRQCHTVTFDAKNSTRDERIFWVLNFDVPDDLYEKVCNFIEEHYEYTSTVLYTDNEASFLDIIIKRPILSKEEKDALMKHAVREMVDDYYDI